jgi:hypothetical protein
VNASANDTVNSLKKTLGASFKSIRGKKMGESTYSKVDGSEKLSQFESIVAVPKVDGGQ